MQFDELVLAGGGNRCWWQAGFWHEYTTQVPQKIHRVSGVSAGAAMACLLYARPGTSGAIWGLEYYARVLQNVKRNVQLEKLFSSQSMFPHYPIYKNALLNMLSEGFDQLKTSAPPIHIGLSLAPSWLGPRSATVLGLMAYQVEKKLKHSLHPVLGQKLGFQRQFILAQTCKDIHELVELILQSSATPPFTPLMKRNGQVVLDGGLVDNVPVDGVTADPSLHRCKEVLVLLTRKYPVPNFFVRELPGVRLTYVQPITPVPVGNWDYTRPDLIAKTYWQGVADAKLLIKKYQIFQSLSV